MLVLAVSSTLRFFMKLSLIAARTLWVYSMLIWVRIMLGWFIPYPREKGFLYYIYKSVDVYLNLFRGKLLVAGRLDFSPIIGIGLIEILQAILQYFAYYGKITLSYTLALFLNMLWGYCIRFFFLFIGFLLLIKTICSFSSNPNVYAFGSRISSSITPITNLIRKVFFKNRIVRDSTLSIIALIITVLLYFGFKYLFGTLISLCYRIPF